MSQLERMGFEMTGQWRQGRESISQLDVLVHDSFRDAVFFVTTLFGYTEIMSGQRMSIGVIRYKGAPLLLRLHKASECN